MESIIDHEGGVNVCMCVYCNLSLIMRAGSTCVCTVDVSCI